MRRIESAQELKFELCRKYLDIREKKDEQLIVTSAVRAGAILQSFKFKENKDSPQFRLKLNLWVDIYNFWVSQLNKPSVTTEQVLSGEKVEWVHQEEEKEKPLPIAVIVPPDTEEPPIVELIGLFIEVEARIYYGTDNLIRALISGIKFAGIIGLHLASPKSTRVILEKQFEYYGQNELSLPPCKDIVYSEPGPESLILLIDIVKMVKGE